MDNIDGSKWKPALLVNEGFDYEGGTDTPVGGIKEYVHRLADNKIGKQQNIYVHWIFSIQSLNIVGGTLVTRTMSRLTEVSCHKIRQTSKCL